MIGSLPEAIIYMDAIKGIDDLSQKMTDTIDSKRSKSQALARLKVIEKTLRTITKQPNPEDVDYKEKESKLVLLRKQYNAISVSISNSTSIENTRNELNILKDQSSNLEDLNNKCVKERKVAGWDEKGGKKSVLKSAVGKTVTITGTGKSSSGRMLGTIAGAQLGPLGSFFGGLWGSSNSTARNIQIKTNGSEIEQFCDLPIVSGFSHGDIIRVDDSNRGSSNTFRNTVNPKGNEGYRDLPMVNALYVYGDIIRKTLSTKDARLSVNIDCDVLFKAKPTDYTHAGDPSF